MKAENLFSCILGIFLLALLSGCMAAPFIPQAVMMGASAVSAIEDASINAAVSPGITKEQLGQIKRVAFVFSEDKPTVDVPFAPGGLKDIMADNLTIEMMKLGFECIERQKLRKVLEEQGLQMSGFVEDDAIKAGKIIGVQAIITGSVQSSTSMSMGYMGMGGTKMTTLVQSATFKIIGVEKADILMVVAINYKHGQKPNIAAESMAQIIKAKLEDPFGKEIKK
jgi:curli biogenesis system outer membrane secretion channel CsgG